MRTTKATMWKIVSCEYSVAWYSKIDMQNGL